MKELTIEEKIAEIKNTSNYQQVSNAWFPPYYEKEYYFVSYSHKDYKLVYESLHRLQSGEKRLNLWYDHNLTPGRDWEIEARRYIYDFNCKGVIFFLSENAVLSQSIHKEIEFVKNSGKSYLSINLPCEKIEGHIGEYLSAAQMLELLKQQDYEIENYDEKSAVLNETFNSKITYLQFNQEIELQIDKILSLKRQPLLNFAGEIVTSINDINVLEIKKEDFEYFDEYGNHICATYIGDCAFANCKYLSKIELPEDIRSIGSFVFYNCENLKAIELPKYLSNITPDAFSGCYSLECITVDNKNNEYSSQDGILYNKEKTEMICVPQDIKGKITIPNSVTFIFENAFERRRNLENIKIEFNSNLTSIGDGAFLGCGNLRSVYFEYNNNLISIGVGAFVACENLESVNLGNTNKLTSIGGAAFDGCVSLKNIVIPDSVTFIGESAFDGCASLKNIVIPDGVTFIGERAFGGCVSLKSITVNENNTIYSSQDGVLYTKDKAVLIKCPEAKTSIIIPNSVTSIGQYAFELCENLEVIIFEDNSKLTSISDEVFINCAKLNAVYVTNIVAWCNIEFGYGSNLLGNAYNLYLNNHIVTKLNLPWGVKKIENYAFNNCISLESIIIPDSVTYISISALEGCSSLESIIVGENNKNYSSQDGLLYNKDKTELIRIPQTKTAVSIPDSVINIDNNVFRSCKCLENIIVCESNTVYSSQDGLLYNKDKTELIRVPPAKIIVSIPNDVTHFGDAAFRGCTSLESITIPDSVTSIGDYAFSGCTSLESITIGNGVTSIGGDAFSGCTELIQTQDGVQYVDKWVVACDISITTVNLRADTKGIADGAFSGCYILTSITIPDSVTSIGGDAFSGCTSLESITIPDSVTSIGDYAFDGCDNLTSITIPDSVTSIGESVFDGCTKLESIFIPKCVISIDSWAFDGCTNLNDIFYKGTKLQWKSIDKGNNWDDGTPGYTVHCTDGDLKKGEF